MRARSKIICTSMFLIWRTTSAHTCPEGEHWVRPHHRSSYFRSDGTPVSAANVSGHCKKNPPGFSFWNPRKKSGLPPNWEHPKEKPKGWTDEEWEQVLDALSSLPPLLWIPTIDGLYRLEKSVFFPNAASGDGKHIALYNTAFESKDKLSRILAHELSHDLYRNMSDADKNSYLNASQWFERQVGGKTLVVRGRNKNQFVEPDGMDSPSEDFSNNIEYYLFNPKKLEAVSPSTFSWIQLRYGKDLRLKGGESK